MGPWSSALTELRRRRALAGLLAAAVALVAALATSLALPLPAAWFAPQEHTRVLDRRGELLAERVVPDRGRSEWVELGDVSPWVVPALLAAEDHRFGHHVGVDPIAVGRALWTDLRHGQAVEGASTLHQQTARLLAGRPPGWAGKGVEAWRAVRLWAHLRDDEVLTWYLNRAYFGRGCHGITSAARRTFDESPGALSLSEAATLVGLLPAPSCRHPEVDPEAARAARDRVLDRMLRYGLAGADVIERARAEPIELRRGTVRAEAPWFVEHVLAEAPAAPEVRTTLDAELQRDVTALVRDRLEELQDRRVGQAAVLVVHLPDREIRAWVGSVDPSGPEGLFDGVTAHRSPGSALKPLLYAAAFDEGLRPSDVLLDVEGRWPTTHGSWLPENYDRRHLGPVDARRALGSSLNVPAVRVLEDLGVASFQARLTAAGFRTRRTATSLGLGLSLGDLDVSLFELVRASAALATDGRVRPLRATADDPGGPAVAFCAPESAQLVTDVLADPSARAAGFGRHGPLERPYPAAAKTGTSTGFRDNWTIGWTPEWLVGVWVGNFDGSAMQGVSGVTGAGPLWARILDRVVGDDALPFAAPADRFEAREVCALSGGAPGPDCPRTRDWFLPSDPARPACPWHVPGCGVAWPPELAGWAADAGLPACRAATPSGGLRIAWPEEGAEIWVDPRLPAGQQRLALRVTGPSGAGFSWRVDGEDLGPGGVGEPLLWTAPGSGEHLAEVIVDGVVVDRRWWSVRGGR